MSPEAAKSKRQRILEAVLARVQTIRRVDGYQTDVGATVFFGESPELGESDPEEAAAVVPASDVIVAIQGTKVTIELPIAIQALARADLAQPWVAVEAVISDIKTAVEVADQTLGGLAPRRMRRGSTRPIPRDPGSVTVAAEVPYIVPYDETWGAP